MHTSTAACVSRSRLTPLIAAILLTGVSQAASPATQPGTPRVLISEAFDDLAANESVSLSAAGVSLGGWDGADGTWGTIRVSSTQHAGSSGKSLCFTDASAKDSQAPILTASWPAPTDGVLRIEWKFLTPDRDLTNINFIGGSTNDGWSSAAAIFMVADGKFSIQYGDQAKRAVVAPSYEPNGWYTVRCDIRLSERTFDLYIDGKLQCRSYPVQATWQAAGNLIMGADFAAVDRAGKPVLYVDDLYVVTAQNAAELQNWPPRGANSLTSTVAAQRPAFTVRVDAKPGNFVVPGAESAAALVITNQLDRQIAAKFSATISGIDGTPTGTSQNCLVPAKGRLRLPLPLGDKRHGIRYIDWTLTDDARHRQSGQCTYVYGTPAGPGPDPAGFLYSICAHIPTVGNPARDEQQVSAASMIGVNTMRVGIDWDGLEPEANAWSKPALDATDNLMALGKRYQMGYQYLLSYCSPYAANPSAQAAYAAAVQRGDKNAREILLRSAPDDAAWRRYIRTLVTRYRDQIHLWEVWNEPDLTAFLGTTDEYIRMLRSAHDEIKKASPAATVMSGGFATLFPHEGRKRNPNLQQRVLSEAPDAFDVHAFHQHGDFGQFKQAVDDLTELRIKTKVTHPIYFNETAVTSSFSTERAQAITLVKKLSYARAHGAIGYTWYDMVNDGDDPSNGEHNYGLLRSDMQPKAVYAAYNELIRRMRGTRFIGSLDLGPGRYALAFAGRGRRLLVLWTEDPALPDEPLAIRAEGCQGGEVSDIMGNTQPLTARDGALVLRPSYDPTYIAIPGGESLPVVAGPLVSIAGDTRTQPGDRLALTARLANPTTSILPLDLAWTGSEGPVSRHIELAPSGRQDVPLSFRCPADAKPSQSPAVSVRYSVPGGPWTGEVAVPLQVALMVPSGDPAGRAPEFVLDTHESIVNYCEADPTLVAHTWHGPDDLSARIWLGRGDDSLREIYLSPTSGIATADDVGLACKTIPGGMAYDIALPYVRFGLSDRILENGIRFNLIVNDDDGPMRKGYIRIAPGIGETKDTSHYPLIRFPASR